MNWRKAVRSNAIATFSETGWKSEYEVLKRQRKSVYFVMSALVIMAAFWTSLWAWVIFFGVMALYSLAVGVRIAFICGLSFSLWFLAGIEGWIVPLTWQNQVAGLWCIGTLFLLVVWKADAVAQAQKVLEEVEPDKNVNG